MSAVPTLPLARFTVWLAKIFAGLMVAGAIYIAFDGDPYAELVAAIIASCGLLVVAGLYISTRTAPWRAVAFIVVGALVGSALLLWTIVIPVAGLALAGLVARDVRRTSPATVRSAG